MRAQVSTVAAMLHSASKRAWNHRLPRKVRSDEGVSRSSAAREAAASHSALPALRLGHSLKPARRGHHFAGRRGLPANRDTAAACTPARETDVSLSCGQALSVSQRIPAGRTARRLQHIQQFHLFQRPSEYLDGPSDAAPGLSAMRHGQLSIVMDFPFTRRFIKMVDVMPLVRDSSVGGMELSGRLRTVTTCRHSELSDIGALPLRMLPRPGPRLPPCDSPR